MSDNAAASATAATASSTSAATSTQSTATTVDHETAAPKVSHKCQVLIIGAGMAGLSAAQHLSKNGLTDFKILEARSRIGGRIISIEMSKKKIELGANWIHGVLGNPIFELAMSHGLVDIINVPKPHKIVAATEDGKQVPFAVLQEIYEAYICFLRRCEEYFLCQYIPPPDVHSVGEHIQLESDIYLAAIADAGARRQRQLIFDCLLKRETCIAGCDTMDEIDLLELGSYTELQGGNIVLDAGYSAILEPIMQGIPAEAVVKSCAVRTIHWKRKRGRRGSPPSAAAGELATLPEEEEAAAAAASLTSEEEEEAETDEDGGAESDDSGRTVVEVPIGGRDCNVRVECANGSTYYADHVICAVPLGVLKERHAEMFAPPLPQYKVESVEALLFGTVDKIFLEYERPFLNADISEVMLLWDETEELVPEEGTAEAREYLAANWFKKIYSFSKLSETLLLGWVSGREAEHMETLTHEAVGEVCTGILRRFLRDPYVPKPKRCVCTSWHKQKFSRGSYTAMAVGASQEDIENIAQPMYSSPHQSKPAVLFAGEHTHTNFYSTVHGAYLSGRTAAQILLTPDSPQEIVMESDDSDLSAWIQGIALE